MTADFINLLDSTGGKIVDSVSTEYEDSFSLESFGDLIKAYVEAEPKGKKAFIIARVQTWDRKQPERAFYSYYDAYHLNKILFQTQVYLGKKLIHRLHVLNPLSGCSLKTGWANSDIIGNVLYFRISRGPWSEPPPEKSGADAAAKVPVVIGTAQITDGRPARQRPGEIASQGPPRWTGAILDRVKAAAAAGPAIAEEETGVLPEWTLASPAVAEVTEEEGNVNANAPFPNRRISITPGGSAALTFTAHRRAGRRASDPSPAAASKTESGAGTGPAGSLARLTEAVAPVAVDSAGLTPQAPMEVAILPVAEEVGPGGGEGDAGGGPPAPLPPPGSRRRRVSYENRAKPPTAPIILRRRTRSNAPKGVVTQFTVPVPDEKLDSLAPKTPPGRRRTLSFANAVASTAVQGGSAVSALRDWARMLRTEEAVPREEDRYGPKSAPVDAFPNRVLPFAQTVVAADIPAKPGASPSVRAAPAIITTQAAEATAGGGGWRAPEDDENPAAAAGEEQPIFPISAYDATLVGTDNDYLESSKTRLLFRENSVRPEDVQLFEMPEYKGEAPTTGAPLILQEQAVCDSCYPSPQQLERATPAMRMFHLCKCYITAVVLLGVVLGVRRAAGVGGIFLFLFLLFCFRF
ncbi:MAG: hypothetical protein BJ554DRAFT_5772 [Olpidium bornovanus]|uniref:Uncharacterized protein n=1 Tax=Olpidium bornovanus TaxID=278681 RepID=A0A8H7ZZ88_9FUNG|nr:MAG: hypothetical protein BJ554DRAFT_5772 [Olpidium bornovanus]